MTNAIAQIAALVVVAEEQGLTEAAEELTRARLHFELAEAQAENRRLKNEAARKAEAAAARVHVAEVVELDAARKAKAAKAPKAKRAPKTLPAVEVEPGQFVEVTPKTSIRLFGEYRGESYDRTFEMGATVDYDSYNLTYLGEIVGIGAKTVSVKDMGRVKRLKLYTFNWRNRNLDLEAIAERNHDTMMHI